MKLHTGYIALESHQTKIFLNMYPELEVSIIIPLYFNQKNTETLTSLLKTYRSYSKDLLAKIEFVFVDDCSPLEVTIPENCSLNYQLFRITDDIQWNQSGAKNLGATYAKSQKLIFSDTDHLFSEEILKKIVKSSVPKHLYHFKTIDSNGVKQKRRTPGILYCSKATFFTGLGYDEEFSGYYGCEDVFFREYLTSKKIKFKYFSRRHRITSVIVNREDSYHSLDRNFDRNLSLLNKKLELLRAHHESHSKNFLCFSWTLKTEKYSMPH